MPKKPKKRLFNKRPAQKIMSKKAKSIRLNLYAFGKCIFYICSIAIIALGLLFYPGDSYYISLAAYHGEFFEKHKESVIPNFITIPYLKNNFFYPAVSAQGVYIVEKKTGTPLYKKNEHARFLPASTTKIITSLTILDELSPEDSIEIKRNMDDGQVVGFKKGEKLTLENILYAALVHSGNDAAYAIADNYPKGYVAFISAMNKKAQSLHMQNSSFINPAGFDSAGQYSSAFDLSLAARVLLQNKLLSKIVSTKAITISDIGFKNFHDLSNVNKLLGEIPGIGGLKTGYTEGAKENLVTFYTHRGRDYIIVLLKSDDRFQDTKIIVDWINNNVSYKVVSLL